MALMAVNLCGAMLRIRSAAHKVLVVVVVSVTPLPSPVGRPGLVWKTSIVMGSARCRMSRLTPTLPPAMLCTALYRLLDARQVGGLKLVEPAQQLHYGPVVQRP